MKDVWDTIWYKDLLIIFWATRQVCPYYVGSSWHETFTPHPHLQPNPLHKPCEVM